MTQAVAQMQHDVSQTREEAREQVAELRDECQKQHQRVESIEKNIQELAANTCSKADLSAVLAEALAKQSSELQGWLAKRSPEPSPVNDPNKVPKHS